MIDAWRPACHSPPTRGRLPAAKTFDPSGAGGARRSAGLLAALKGYNIVGIFHGHEHPTPMIYNREGYDIFKPVAAFMGGYALVRVTDAFMDVVLARVGDTPASPVFTHAFSKRFRS